MYLDYSKLEFDSNGLPETPQLVLKTLGDKMIGIIPGAFNIKFNIKFSEPSEMSFDIPSVIDGKPNPLYEDVTGYKQIYTKCYGVFVTMSPETEADGIREVKHVTAYSYEKTLESKKMFLEEGTFNFWNPVSKTDTVLGRILEVAPGWSVGYVSPALIGKYRTFDQYDNYVLSFMYNSAPEKYRCVFVFDTYKKTINVYDADEERPTLPIYLDFDNLIQSLDIEEKSDELVTAIRPYGADELDIREVNPIGTNWIYDLSYFIANGDIQGALASKWTAWQQSVLNRQTYYRGLTALRASTTANLTAAQAELTDLNGELETLVTQQSVTIQAHALETTDAGKAYQQSLLDDINKQIAAKKAEIAAQESSITSIQNSLTSYASQIQSIVNELSISNYFTDAEYKELSNYFIEQDITEDTFVATDVDTTISGSSHSLSGGTLSVTGSAISAIDLTSQYNKRMYTLAGGTFSLTGQNMSGDIIRGTLEVSTSGSYVLSFYAGTIRVNDKTALNGMITLSGTLSGFTSNVKSVTTMYETDSGASIGITTDEGTSLSFRAYGTLFLTANVNEFQRYSVSMELYEYAAGVLDDIATPTYEFSVDSANFLFAQEFEPFRNRLELGKGVYLNIGGKQTITPYIIEFELDFENRERFSIVFSNRFKRHDNVNTLKDMLESTYSTSRSLDASKYIYNQTAAQASAVSEFMANSFEAAKNTILGAKNQSVVINGAGIHVGGDSKYQIRVVDSMIAMSDDNWATCKLAIGHFASPEVGEYFGVNADIIGGKLLIGNNLVIDTGKGHFKVDESGVYINSMKFYIQNDENKSLNDEFDAISRELDGLESDLNSVDSKLTKKIEEFYKSGYLDAGKLSGVISAMQAKMQSGSGNVLFDADGMWLLNGTTKANSTKAIWMNENGILFGSGSRTSDPGKNWTNWTTAIGHEGIVASNIAAGTLSGMTINGGEITIGKSSTSDTSYFYVDGNGNLGIGRNTSKTKGYNFYVDSNGNLYAESGTFKGKLEGATGTFSGSLNAATGTFSGDISAASGTFKGTIQASKYLDSSGRNMMSSGKFTADYLDLKGLNINNNFIVDSNGNVTIRGGSISWSAVTGTSEIDSRISNAQTAANNASTAARNAQSTADDAYSLAAANKLPSYIKSTYIDSTRIESPTIRGGTLEGGVIAGGEFTNLSNGGYITVGTGTYGDIYVYSRSSSRQWEVFRIYDEVSAVSLYTYGHRFLTGSASAVNAVGTWNFSSATVTGLNTSSTAVWG